MIQSGSLIQAVDNSGAKSVRCIKVLKKKKIKLLDHIMVSIQSYDRLRKNRTTKKVYLGLILGLKNNSRRLDGSFFKLKQNNCILLSSNKKLVGFTIYSPLNYESVFFFSNNLKKTNFKVY